MRFSLLSLATVATAVHAVAPRGEVDPLACFSPEEDFRIALKNPRTARSSTDDLHCLTLPWANQQQYNYDCNHPDSLVVGHYDANDRTMKIRGYAVRCPVGATKDECQRLATEEGTCEMEFVYRMKGGQMNQLSHDVSSPMSGYVQCGDEIMQYSNVAGVSALELARTAQQESLHHGRGHAVAQGTDSQHKADWTFRAECLVQARHARQVPTGVMAGVPTLSNTMPTTGRIEGRVYRDDQGGREATVNLGIPSVSIIISNFATQEIVGIVTTDITGRYIMENAKPGTYVIKVDQTTIPGAFKPRGEPDAQQTKKVGAGGRASASFCMVTIGGVANVEGYVFMDDNTNSQKEAAEVGIPNVRVAVMNKLSKWVVAVVNTDSTGKYRAPTLPPAIYVVRSDPTTLSAGLALVSGSDMGTDITLVDKQTGRVDFPYKKALPGAVKGRVYRNDVSGKYNTRDLGLPFVRIVAIDPTTGKEISSNYTTVTGEYEIRDLVPGQYLIRVDPKSVPEGFQPKRDPDREQMKMVRSQMVTQASFCWQPINPAVLTGVVYRDENGNRVADTGDFGLPGVVLNVTDRNGRVVAIITTYPNGTWIAPSIPAGTYRVSVDQTKIPNTVVPVSDADKEASVTVAKDQTATVNFFYRPARVAPGTAEGFVYMDDKKNNIFDLTADRVVRGITIQIVDPATGKVVGSATSDSTGKFVIPDLPPGKYIVRPDPNTPLAGYTPNVAQQEITIATGSTVRIDIGYCDVDECAAKTGQVHNCAREATCVNSRGSFTCSCPAGYNGNGVYCDYIDPNTLIGNISGIAYVDTDNNNSPSTGEPGIPGITVVALQNGVVVATTTTDANGRYTFPSLKNGNYIIRAQTPVPVGFSASANLKDVTVEVKGRQTATANFPFRQVVGTVQGTIFLDDNASGQQETGEKGAAGVRVLVLDRNTKQVIASATTDADGKYTLPNVPPGTYLVTVDNTTTPANYVPTFSVVDIVRTIQGDDRTIVDFAFRPQRCGLTGVVFHDQSRNSALEPGEPGLLGVKVSIVAKSTGVTVANFTTDATGKFTSGHLRPGTYVVSVDPTTVPKGYEPLKTMSVEVTMANDQTGQVYFPFVLKKGTIEGSIFRDDNGNGVRDPNEQAFGGVKIQIIDKDTGKVVTVVTTEENGKFSVPGLDPGNYIIRPDPATLPPGFSTSSPDIEVVVKPGESTNVTIPYTPKPISFSGSVVDDFNGNGVRDPTEGGLGGIRITVTDKNTGKVVAILTTDSSGKFAVGDLPPGTYIFTADPATIPPGYEPTKENFIEVTFGPGQSSSGSIMFRPKKATINGFVFYRQNASPTGTKMGLTNVRFSIVDAATNKPVDVVTAGADGRFSAPNLLPGRYIVRVIDSSIPRNFAADDANAKEQTITVKAGETVNVEFCYRQRMGSLNGFVFRDMNGDRRQAPNDRPISGVKVNVVHRLTRKFVASTTTDVNGRFVVDKLLPGDYVIGPELATIPEGFVPSSNVDRAQQRAVMADRTTPSMFAFKPIPAVFTGGVTDDKNGNGVRDPTEGGLPGIKIIITDKETGQVVGVVTSDANGKFTLPPLIPGIYVFKPDPATIPPGYVPATENGGEITREVKPGEKGTIEFFFKPKKSTVQGVIYRDVNKNGVQDPTEAGVPGVTVRVVDRVTGAVVATVTTDSSGRYTVPGLIPGDYVIKVDQGTTPNGFNAMGVNGAGPEAASTLKPDEVQTINFALQPTNGTLQGTLYRDPNSNSVQDPNEPGMANVRINITDRDTGRVVAIVTTDANGKYTADLPLGNYVLVIDPTTVPTGWVPTMDNGGRVPVTINPGTTTAISTGYKPLKASISGTVFQDRLGRGTQDPSFPGMAGVKISIIDQLTKAVVAIVTTDAAGKYATVGLAPGNYALQVDPPTIMPGYRPVAATDAQTAKQLQPGENAVVNFSYADVDECATDANNCDTMATCMNTFGSFTCVCEYGYQGDGVTCVEIPPKKSSVSGVVFQDTDGDNIQDPNEPGMENIRVQIVDKRTGADIATVTTDASGRYNVPDLDPLAYIVRVDPATLPRGYSPSTAEVSKTLTPGETWAANLGLKPAGGTFQGTLFEDTNGNGVMDPNERGIPGVKISIIDKTTGNVVSTITTDANGKYTIPDVPLGTYILRVDPTTVPKGYVPTTLEDKEITRTIRPGENVPIDFAYKPVRGVIQGIVFFDKNEDGKQGTDEATFPGVRVVIRDAKTGAVVGTAQADASGLYVVKDLLPGSYNITVDPTTLPRGYEFTPTGILATVQAGETTVASVPLTCSHITLTGSVIQDINGNGIQETTDSGMPNIKIVITDRITGKVVATVTSDAKGAFTFPSLRPGTYDVRPDPATLPANYLPVTESDIGQVVTAEPGKPISVVFRYKPKRSSIEGTILQMKNGSTVVDPNAPGLPGIKIELVDKNTGKVIATVVTDQNGKYSFGDLIPGNYIVRPDPTTLPPGYVLENKEMPATVKPGETTKVDFSYVAKNGTFTGSVFQDTDVNGVRDPTEPGLAGIKITIIDRDTGKTVAIVTTDSTGKYTASIPPGNYILKVDPTTVPSGYLARTPADMEINMTLQPGATTPVSFAYKPKPSTIQGTVFNDILGTYITSGPGLAGIKVDILDANTGRLITSAYTDSNGRYAATNLIPGDYNVRVDPATLPKGYVPTRNIEGMVEVVLTPGEVETVNFCFKPQRSTITGTIFQDSNGDNMQGANEPGVPGVTIVITDKVNGSTVATVTTDAFGRYSVPDLVPGTYVIRPQNGTALNSFTTATITNSVSKTLGPNESAVVNFGFLPRSGSISGYIREDPTGTGKSDPNAPGIGGVKITVTDNTGKVIYTTTTDPSGKYVIPELSPGNYTVKVDPTTLPPNYKPFGPSDVEFPVNVTPGGKIDKDIIYVPQKATVSGVFFQDSNANGQRDPNERGLPGITINIIDASTGKVVATVTTGTNGSYTFPNLNYGTYIVRPDPSTIPEGHYPVSTSDKEITVTLRPGNSFVEDFAYAPKSCSVRGAVLQDIFPSRSVNYTEPGFPNVAVSIIDKATGNAVASFRTDSMGRFSAPDLQYGTYIVRVDVTTVPRGWTPAAATDRELEFTLKAGQVTFIPMYYRDIDECSAAKHNCNQYANCSNSLGSFLCMCGQGYNGDGVFCQPNLPQKGTFQGIVFQDTNGDTAQDPTDSGLANIRVNVIDPATGKIVATTTTTAGGKYSIPDVPVGTYILRLDPASIPAGYVPSTDAVKEFRADITPAGTVNISFPLKPQKATLTGVVFRDPNQSGVQEAGEPAQAGVRVIIKDATTGQTVATLVTDSNGRYTADLQFGRYRIEIDQSTVPAGYVPTTPADAIVTKDLTPGSSTVTNFAYKPKPVYIIGRIVEDWNTNGIRDGNEGGVPGVRVIIKDQVTGAVLASVLTDANGTYTSPALKDGSFLIQVEPTTVPSVYLPNGQNDIETVRVIAPGNSATVDFFYHPKKGSFSGTIFQDNNRNGVRDPNEPGLPGVRITVVDKDTGKIVAVVTTDQNGKYMIDLPPGNYIIRPDPATLPPNYYPTGPSDKDFEVQLIPGGAINNDFSISYKPITINGSIFGDVDGNGNQTTSETGLSGVKINVIDKNTGKVVMTVTSDASGRYTIPDLVPGTYIIRPDPTTLPPGYDPTTVSDKEITRVFMAGDQPTINFSYTPRRVTIDGVLYFDTNGNGVRETGEGGIPNVRVLVVDRTTGAVIGSGVTDSTGRYVVSNLIPGTYAIRPDPATLPANYLPTSDQDRETTRTLAPGTTATVQFGYKPKSATISGVMFSDDNSNGVPDNGEAGFAAIPIQVLDINGNIVARAVTDGNGRYTITNLPPGNYTIRPNPVNLPPGYSPTSPNDRTTTRPIVPGDNATINFAFKPNPSCIHGSVYKDLNTNSVLDMDDEGFEDVKVTLTGMGRTLMYTTNLYGNWTFPDLLPGTYMVKVDLTTVPAGWTAFTPTSVNHTVKAGNTDTVHFGFRDVDECTSTTIKHNCHAEATCENTDGSFTCSCNYGFQGTGVSCAEIKPAEGSFQGMVFQDMDGNGMHDTAEMGLPNVKIEVVLKSSGAVVSSATTDAAGKFFFANLPSKETYVIRVVQASLPTGHVPTSALDAQVEKYLNAGETQSLNFAYRPVKATMSGVVYKDEDGSGIQEAGEPGIAGAKVTVIDRSTNTLVVTVSTDANGKYTVPSLKAGTFIVRVDQTTVPEGYAPTTAADSETTRSVSYGGNAQVSFGYKPKPSTISGFIYQDNNANGARDSTDSGLSGVRVVLKDKAGTVISTAVTDATGKYTFTNVKYGDYVVSVDKTSIPAGYNAPTVADSAVTINPGTTTAVDFGAVPKGSSIGGVVFQDVSKNGVQESGEPGLAGITVTLTDSTGKTQTVTTDASGRYTLASLPVGSYTIRVESSTVPAGHDPTGPADIQTTRTLSPGQTVTANFAYKPRPATINGSVNGVGNGTYNTTSVTGLGGVKILIINKATGQMVATVTTDANGKFQIPDLPFGDYILRPDPTTVPSNWEPATTADQEKAITLKPGQVTDISFNYKQKTGTFTGFLFADPNENGAMDNGEKGIPNVRIQVINPVTGAVVSTVETDATGKYTISGLPPGQYTLRVDNTTLPAGYLPVRVTDSLTTVTVQPGGTSNVNFAYKPKGVTLSGSVIGDTNADRNPANPGLAGIRIVIVDKATGSTVTTTTTSAMGTFSVTGLLPGTYITRVDFASVPVGYLPTAAQDKEATNTLDPGESASNTFFYYPKKGGFYGSVFQDPNQSGTQENGEPGVSGVKLIVTDKATGKVVATITTDANGKFNVTGTLLPGTYIIKVDPTTIPAGYEPLTPLDSEVTKTIAPGENLAINISFKPKLSSISGTVYDDSNGDGVERLTIAAVTTGEAGLSGVRVTIVSNTTGVIVATLTTDSAGKFSTSNLPFDTYVVRVDTTTVPVGYQATTPTSVNLAVAPGSSSTVNFGFQQQAKGYVEGIVFEDRDASGILDPTDPGFTGVKVTLTQNGKVIASTTTNVEGWYMFDGLAPGSYVVTVDAATVPSGFVSSGTSNSATKTVPAGSGVRADFGYKKSMPPPVCTSLPAEKAIYAEDSISLCVLGGHSCHADALCLEQDDGSYTCQCKKGFSGDGERCQPISCNSTMWASCPMDARCVVAATGPACTCRNGYTGSTACPATGGTGGEGACMPSQCITNNPCNEYATCLLNEDGTTACRCNDGFSGDGKYCIPLACSKPATCDGNAICARGSQLDMCYCKKGYEGDGKNCAPVGCAASNSASYTALSLATATATSTNVTTYANAATGINTVFVVTGATAQTASDIVFGANSITLSKAGTYRFRMSFTNSAGAGAAVKGSCMISNIMKGYDGATAARLNMANIAKVAVSKSSAVTLQRHARPFAYTLVASSGAAFTSNAVNGIQFDFWNQNSVEFELASSITAAKTTFTFNCGLPSAIPAADAKCVSPSSYPVVF